MKQVVRDIWRGVVVLINVRLLAHVTVSRDMLASFCGDFCFLVVYVARDVVLKPMGKKIVLCTIRKFCPRCKCAQDASAPTGTPSYTVIVTLRMTFICFSLID